jgi:hypothetical protein
MQDYGHRSFFKTKVALEHRRFVMQYKAKSKQQYLKQKLPWSISVL